jgi:hypothetical protein
LKLEADDVAVERGRRLDIIDDEDDLSQSAAEQRAILTSSVPPPRSARPLEFALLDP